MLFARGLQVRLISRAYLADCADVAPLIRGGILLFERIKCYWGTWEKSAATSYFSRVEFKEKYQRLLTRVEEANH